MPLLSLRATARLALVMSGLALACSSSSSSTAPPTTTKPPPGETVTISQRVASPDGLLTVDVPEGALPAGTTVTIAPATSAPDGHVGPAYEISPSGVTFTKPVLLRFKLPSDPGVLEVARNVNGTWKPLREQYITGDEATALTSHFSVYSLVSGAASPLTSQVSSYASLCKLDCSAFASCVPAGAPSGAGACDLPETGWSAGAQKSALQCLEQKLSEINPKKVSVTTGPCSPCLRECCTTRLSAAGACECFYDEHAQIGERIHDESASLQNTAWLGCASKCVDEPLPPSANVICGADVDVLYVTPTITSAQSGAVLEPGTVHRGSSVLVTSNADPTSVAIDEAGNVFFTEYQLNGALRATLRKRAPNGTVSDVATILDQGGVTEAWEPRLAISPTGTVAYTVPIIDAGPGAGTGGSGGGGGGQSSAGAIRTVGGADLVSGLTDEPAALTFDATGALYYVTLNTTGSYKFTLHKRPASGGDQNLGVLVDSAGAGIRSAWRMQLAVTKEGDVYYSTPLLQSPSGGSVTKNATIQKLGGSVVLESSTAEFDGLAFDPSGAMFYAERTTPPLRITLKKRDASGAISDFGVVVDSSRGGVFEVWGFSLAIPPPQ